MPGTPIDVPSYVADSLNVQFGPDVMAIVATEFILKKLLNDLAYQTSSSVDELHNCVDQAFSALAQYKQLSPYTLDMARISVRHLSTRVQDFAEHEPTHFSTL